MQTLERNMKKNQESTHDDGHHDEVKNVHLNRRLTSEHLRNSVALLRKHEGGTGGGGGEGAERGRNKEGDRKGEEK